MMDKPHEKQKRGERSKSWHGYAALALAFALGLCLIHFQAEKWKLFFISDRLFLYPLLLLTHSSVFWVAIGVLFIGLVLVAMRQVLIRSGIAILISGLLMVGHEMIIDRLEIVTHQQTLVAQDETYQLIISYGRDRFDLPVKAHRVFQCDNTGLICQYYALYLVSEPYEQFYESGRLYIDKTDHKLMMQMGDEAYSVDDDRRILVGY